MKEQTQQKITDNFDRKKLGEGRNFGLGFSILKKLEDSNFETLMAFTACKDYLNDFMYVEHFNKVLGIAHGFKHEYTGILKDQKFFYSGFRALNSNHSTEKHQDFDKIQKAIVENYTNIIRSINQLEEFFNLEDKTKFESLIDDVLLVKTPVFWSTYPFLFSMYGLFIRCFLNVTEEESNLDITTLVKNKEITLISQDRIMMEPMKKFFNKPNKEKLLEYKYIDNVPSYTVHNYGINSRLIEVNK